MLKHSYNGLNKNLKRNYISIFIFGAGGWGKKTYKIKPAAHSHTIRKCIDIKEGVFL